MKKILMVISTLCLLINLLVLISFAVESISSNLFPLIITIL